MKNYTNSSQLGSLPDEIVDDILLCLPAKSLLRFKLVSKLWKSLISDPNFAESHLNRSGNRLRVGQVRAKQETGTNSEVTLSLYSMDCDGSNREVVNQDHDSGRDYISISYHDDDVRVLGSCNGLLLVSTHYRLRDLFLWNPTTGLCRRIVNCVENLSTNTISGLVYDSRSGNYKIIVNDYLSNCNIFDFKLDRWTKKEEYYDYRIHTASSAIMVNGVPHWCVYRYNCPEKRRRRRELYYLIVYFDLETETFKEVNLPKLWASARQVEFGIGVLGGCLCMGLHAQGSIQVWTMKEYGIAESWTKSFVISSPIEVLASPMCLIGKNQLLMKVVEKNNGAKLVIFNVEENTERVLLVDTKMQGGSICTYVGSLAFPALPEELLAALGFTNPLGIQIALGYTNPNRVYI